MAERFGHNCEGLLQDSALTLGTPPTHRKPLTPTDGEVPAEVAGVGLGEDAGVLFELFDDLGAFGTEQMRFAGEGVQQGVYGREAGFAGVPLGRRETLDEVWIAGTLFDQKRHGVLVGGEELDERTDVERERETLERVLVAGDGAPIDEDVEARVLTLDDDVHGSGHKNKIQGVRIRE